MNQTRSITTSVGRRKREGVGKRHYGKRRTAREAYTKKPKTRKDKRSAPENRYWEGRPGSGRQKRKSYQKKPETRE